MLFVNFYPFCFSVPMIVIDEMLQDLLFAYLNFEIIDLDGRLDFHIILIATSASL